MKNFFKNLKTSDKLKQFIVLAVFAFILVGAQRLSATTTWSDPTAAPTAGSIVAPINIGVSSSTIQIIQGKLSMDTLGVFGKAFITSQLLVASTSSNVSSSINLLVDGKTASRSYCDITGTLCGDPGSGKTVLIGSVVGGGGLRMTLQNNVKYGSDIVEWHRLTYADVTARLTAIGITETRRIKALIVKTSFNFSGTTNVTGRYYYANIGMSDAAFSIGIPQTYSEPFYYVSSGGYTTGAREMTTYVERGTSDNFYYYCQIKSYNNATMGATGSLFCDPYVIGYLTE